MVGFRNHGGRTSGGKARLLHVPLARGPVRLNKLATEHARQLSEGLMTGGGCEPWSGFAWRFCYLCPPRYGLLTKEGTIMMGWASRLPRGQERAPDGQSFPYAQQPYAERV